MQVIAVIQDKPVINKILESVGEATQPPSLSPAREPPSWDDYIAQGREKAFSIALAVWSDTG